MKDFNGKTFYTIQQQLRSWDSTAGVTTKLCTRQPRKWHPISNMSKSVCLLQSTHNISGAHLTSYSMGTWCYFPTSWVTKSHSCTLTRQFIIYAKTNNLQYFINENIYSKNTYIKLNFGYAISQLQEVTFHADALTATNGILISYITWHRIYLIPSPYKAYYFSY
jgi:hypothetical protein